jgi:hypothetical protein
MKRALIPLGLMLASPALAADPAPFDLAGPNLSVTVTHQGTTLPVAAVPQLAVGDKLHVELLRPKGDTAHYVLVAAFLRDPTNPPPAGWFTRSETWKDAKHGGGPLDLTIPPDAQHLALLLAPATGGDFTTLRKAVESRPGAFIRAAQDLEQASLDRGRFEAYLTAIRAISAHSPETLAHDAPIIAGSLHIKINEDCLQRQSEYQAACLLDSKQAVVLSGDGSANGSALNGAATDLALSLSATTQGGAGYYSPYISAIAEIVGIFGAMHSAKYQYIPALALAHEDRLSLVLNTPPSFADPKSVLMAALPEIKPLAPLVPHRQPAAPAPCLDAGQAALPLVISPLYYSTGFAHDLHVHLAGHGDLPLVADPMRGGLVIAPGTPLPAGLSGPVPATLQGQWGFESFSGPDLTLQAPGDWHWARKGDDDSPLLLTGAASACVASVTVASHGTPQPAAWKAQGPDAIAVPLPVKEERHEQVTVTVNGPPGTTPAVLMVAPPAKAPAPGGRVIAHSSDTPDTGALAIDLGGSDEIPASARLTFTVKALAGEHFTGRETIDVGTSGSDATTHLSVGNGLTLVDPTLLVASLTPAQALGGSAYGPLRYRLARGDAVGDWMGVGTLVRLPRLKSLDCDATRCTLSGDALYLLASVGATRDFDGAASVPDGFPGAALTVPRPGVGKVLYVRLHDAPELVNQVKVLK